MRGLQARLEALGVRLLEDRGRLKVNAPAGALTPELKEEIRANRPALLLAAGPLFHPDELRVTKDAPQAHLERLGAAKQALGPGWALTTYAGLRREQPDSNEPAQAEDWPGDAAL